MTVALNTGVYSIKNIVNGKRYIGSTTKSFRRRWQQHRNALRSGTHSSQYLQNSWDKYGERSFSFSIVRRCQPDVCLSCEQFFIDRFKCYMFKYGYNRRPIADSNYGVTFGPTTRQKLSIAKKGVPKSIEHRRKISDALRGKKKSAQHVSNMVKSLLGRKLSEETKSKISVASKRVQSDLDYRRRMSESVRKAKSRK